MTPDNATEPEQTLTMPVVPEADTETLPVPETEVLPEPVTEPEAEALAPLPDPEPAPAYLSDFGQQAEAQFLEWVDSYQEHTRADWDKQIGTLNGQRPGTERNRIFGNLDAGMLACRRIAAQAILAALPAARTLATEHAAYGIETAPAPTWTAPLPAIEGLPRHGHRRHGGSA